MIKITTIDAHTEGEPLRVITGGFPDPPGDTMLEKRRFAREHHDDLRCALMWEPRGHADMYGCLLTKPTTEDGDVGVLFLHNEGFSTMCGHGIIGLVKVGIENGLLDDRTQETTVKIDTPAGRVTAHADIENGRVGRVSFLNVPSFVLDQDLEIEGFDGLRCDIAFGGAFYAYVDATMLGLELKPSRSRAIIEAGMAIKRAVAATHDIEHPDGDAELNFLYGTIFVQKLSGPVHSRNACVFANGELDRSPTGTGVSGRAAIHHARGELETGATITIESLFGTKFTVKVTDELEIGGRTAILPEVSGQAWITGRHEFLLDPKDPLRSGFLLR